MSSDAVYSILLYDFVISSANNYKKFGSVELGSVQPVFGITRSGITSGDCIINFSSIIAFVMGPRNPLLNLGTWKSHI